MITQVNEDLLRGIDKLELSDRIRQWQNAMKECPNRIYVDRSPGRKLKARRLQYAGIGSEPENIALRCSKPRKQENSGH